VTEDVRPRRPPDPERRTVIQGGRPKAFRPRPRDDIDAVVRAGIAAYRRGDFFAAHEFLEPAWMGTDDPVERELYQGLIKLAAGGVHRVRGNALGMAKNLRGARTRLERAALGMATGANPDAPAESDERARSVAAGGLAAGGLDLSAILTSIDDVLGELERGHPPERIRSIHLVERRG